MLVCVVVVSRKVNISKQHRSIISTVVRIEQITMKSFNNNIVALATLLTLANTMPEADARSYGTLVAPRSYMYNRPRDPFDLVSDFFRAPLFANSLMKQQQEVQQQLAHASSPRYAVYENNELGTVELEMEVPGVDAKDIEVDLEDNGVLHIKGTRKRSLHESAFDMSFQLADGVDATKMEVTLKAGILRVQVPKKVKSVKRIEVSVREEDDDKILAVKSVTEGENSSSDNSETAEVLDVDGISITDSE
jgi:HSP20 family molecular chaperone IbpA